ncbi:hypothetical protein M378DRAFT_39448, partial [Amanita muscaria Koide BX008]
TFSDFTVSLDKLDVSGSNWIMFQRRFKIAVKQKQIWEFFDGTCTKPTLTGNGKATPAEIRAYNKRIRAWQYHEDLAMYLLSQKLPDSIMSKYMRKETVADMWTAIENEFTEKSMLMQSQLHQEFMAMRYEKGNLRLELD